MLYSEEIHSLKYFYYLKKCIISKLTQGQNEPREKGMCNKGKAYINEIENMKRFKKRLLASLEIARRKKNMHHWYFQNTGSNCQSRTQCPMKMSFKIEHEINIFRQNQKICH